jgi:3-phenylpropionate/trans-cinnamate dioxygenase ferredoxin reductase subunit
VFRQRKEYQMPAEPAFVIVGASLAGAKAAETLRAEGFDGSVVLIGQEDQYPYERPPLSKGYLLGKDSRESVFVQDSDAWYAEHQVDLRLAATVTSIDRAGHRIGLGRGEAVPYDKLLIATGASPRRLDVPGADLGHVHYLRTLPESERLSAALRGGGSVVIAGAGWIGLEVAAAAREYGCEVTVVEPEPGVLHRSLGPELGEVFADLHRSHGVTFRFGEGITELTGSGTVSGAVTSAGEELAADTVLIAVGVVPNAGLAADAGLDVDNGILADEALRTSDPDIFAAGDVANAFNSLLGRRIRVEHWGNALAGGPIAARSMLGRDASYDWVPYFFSDQYDLGMEVAGLPDPGAYDEVVYRGDKESLEFIAFWMFDRVVVAGMNVNVWDVNEDIQALIRSGTTVDPDRLADPDTPLTDL